MRRVNEFLAPSAWLSAHSAGTRQAAGFFTRWEMLPEKKPEPLRLGSHPYWRVSLLSTSLGWISPQSSTKRLIQLGG
ncbi:MAG: hypothetical protein NZ602_08715 [Thermoguttaceae bacterium]|nr:hypothetical protein [Thermoguttaceae bacterium]MDW8038937.1 hypothetical protein [Thermoguttaceae bacterium]